MADLNTLTPAISPDLLEAVKSFPARREVRHCGEVFAVSPFEVYAQCPTCGQRVKVRSFSGGIEIEDVFDAVFAWMSNPDHTEAARQRIESIRHDSDD